MSKKKAPPKPPAVRWTSLGGLMHVELSADLYPDSDRRKKISATVDARTPDNVTISIFAGQFSSGSVTFTREQLRRFMADLGPLLAGGFHTDHTDLQP